MPALLQEVTLGRGQESREARCYGLNGRCTPQEVVSKYLILGGGAVCGRSSLATKVGCCGQVLEVIAASGYTLNFLLPGQP